MTAVRTTLNEPGGHSQPVTPTPEVPRSNADDAVRYLGEQVNALDAGKQDVDALLTSISGLTFGANSFIYGTGTDTAAAGTVTAFARSFMAVADEAAFKQLVNLEIGVDVQAYDADLAAIATLTTTAYGRSMLTYADEAAFKAAVNLEANTDFYAPGGTDVAITDGGTGRSSHTAYAVICGGTTTTGAQQSVASVGTDGQVLRSAGANALPAFEDDIAAIGILLDGNGSAITTGIKGWLQVPFACTIQSVTLLADQTGSIAVDIWKDTYANYPPTDADSITASAVPSISSATKNTDATLTGWTKTIAAGDVLYFNVDSCSTITKCNVTLKVTKS